MKIIISPAKKMNIKTDDFPIDGKPKYLDDAKLAVQRYQAEVL